jgi:hypothetical protein
VIASYPDRRFKVWEFRVSHGSLLIRSPKGGELARNVDIVFVGVDYLALPRVLDGVTVEHGRPTDSALLVGAPAGDQHQRVFVLSSGGHRHVVVAVACRVSETDVDIFDSPF